jgi:bacterioferritin-associated ferredoxin
MDLMDLIMVLAVIALGLGAVGIAVALIVEQKE